jgi:hypothetical protein
MTLSKSGCFAVKANFQQPPPTSISTINLSYCSLSAASFIAAKHIALALAHRPRQPNLHSVCGNSLAQSTRGFVLWRLPDAGPGARRNISHGRKPLLPHRNIGSRFTSISRPKRRGYPSNW